MNNEINQKLQELKSQIREHKLEIHKLQKELDKLTSDEDDKMKEYDKLIIPEPRYPIERERYWVSPTMDFCLQDLLTDLQLATAKGKYELWITISEKYDGMYHNSYFTLISPSQRLYLIIDELRKNPEYEMLSITPYAGFETYLHCQW